MKKDILYRMPDSKEQAYVELLKECVEMVYFGSRLKKDLIKNSSEVSKWWKELDCKKEKWESFLDKVDDSFGKRDIHVYIVYDELDQICGNYAELFSYIRNLLDFWYRHNGRFTNMKAKIFL